MKSFGKILVFLVSIPLALVLILALTIRFQFLREGFYFQAFEKHMVYERLEEEVKSLAGDEFIQDLSREENLTPSEVAQTKRDFSIIAESLTGTLIKEVIEKNISLVLSFVRGEVNELSFHLPLQEVKLPSGFLPSGFGFQGEVPAEALFSNFGAPGLLSDYSLRIKNAAAILSLSIVVLILFFAFFFYLLKERLFGYLLIATSILTAVSATFVRFAALGMQKDLSASTMVGDRIIAIIYPTLFLETSIVWFILAIGLFVGGALFVIVKRNAVKS